MVNFMLFIALILFILLCVHLTKTVILPWVWVIIHLLLFLGFIVIVIPAFILSIISPWNFSDPLIESFQMINDYLDKWYQDLFGLSPLDDSDEMAEKRYKRDNRLWEYQQKRKK